MTELCQEVKIVCDKVKITWIKEEKICCSIHRMDEWMRTKPATSSPGKNSPILIFERSELIFFDEPLLSHSVSDLFSRFRDYQRLCSSGEETVLSARRTKVTSTQRSTLHAEAQRRLGEGVLERTSQIWLHVVVAKQMALVHFAVTLVPVIPLHSEPIKVRLQNPFPKACNNSSSAWWVARLPGCSEPVMMTPGSRFVFGELTALWHMLFF